MKKLNFRLLRIATHVFKSGHMFYVQTGHVLIVYTDNAKFSVKRQKLQFFISESVRPKRIFFENSSSFQMPTSFDCEIA